MRAEGRKLEYVEDKLRLEQATDHPAVATIPPLLERAPPHPARAVLPPVTSLAPPASSPLRPRSLWQHGDFRKLWIGQTVSLLGTQVTGVALALTAVLVLNAGPTEMGLLGAARWVPYLLVGLLAGVWADRVRRRPLLIGTDLGRALLLGSIPVAALLGVLRIEQLYLVALLLGVLSIFFDAAYQAYLPALVRREELVEGNSKLEASRALAQISGASLAGPLVQWLTAPLAILVDAASYLVSAGSLALIRTPEPPVPPPARRNVWREAEEGLRWVYGHPLLRAISVTTVVRFLFSGAWNAIFVLYATRELGLNPWLLGFVLAAGGPGALLGSFVVGRLTRRLGIGPTMITWRTILCAASLLTPLAGWVPTLTVPLLMAGQFLVGLDIAIEGVNDLSLRQAITPAALQGRMNATMRSMNWGTGGIGALLGGFLGGLIGLQATLVLTGLGLGLSALLLALSPLRAVREAPAEPSAG